jgi:hypothetical protein
MPALTQYIQDLLRKGYPIETIKSTLLSYGYPEQTIDQALYNLNKKEIHLSPALIISILLILVAGGGLAFFFLTGEPAVPDQLLDVSITTVSDAPPGEFISTAITLQNMGSSRRYDVYVKYEIFGEAANRVTFVSESVALEDIKTHANKIKIPPETASGTYTLQVSARYQSEVAVAEAPFSVLSDTPDVVPDTSATCTDGLQNQDEEGVDCGGSCPACKSCPSSCDDGDALTVDYCDASTGFSCVHTGGAVCGDGTCQAAESQISCPDDCKEIEQVANPWDEVERIKQLAQTDPGKATSECQTLSGNFRDLCLQNVGQASQNAAICDSIDDEIKKERCCSEFAKATNKPVLCEHIQKESRRDSCYTNFAIKGDYSVCPKISNQYLRQSCETLSQT